LKLRFLFISHFLFSGCLGKDILFENFLDVHCDSLNNCQEFIHEPVYVDLPYQLRGTIDISGLIVDLKYNGNSVKILELGNIMSSALTGHEALYGRDITFRRFWNYVRSFGLHVWCVNLGFPRDCAMYNSYKKFSTFGAYPVCGMSDLLTDSLFRKLHQKNLYSSYENIESFNGMIVFNKLYPVKKLKKKDPMQKVGYLFLNYVAHSYGFDKQRMSLLFDNNWLKQFRPTCKVYKKEYSDKLVEEIKNDFESDILVIKPINASRGWGVIVVKKSDLAQTLKTIFCDIEGLESMDDSYSYWAKYKRDEFLVESFERSKHVVVDGKKYDGTMRVVFSLASNNGQIELQFLGSYWKLPKKSIDDFGSLTEKHKSKIGDGKGMAKVDECDARHVQNLLADLLPKLYVRMIENELC